MKTTRKMLAMTLAATMLLTTACGGSSASTASKPTESSKPAESVSASSTSATEPQTLTLWRAGTDQPERDLLKQLIEKYEEQNPNVKIEYSEAPWGDEIETKLNVAFSSGTGPDIIGHGIASIAERAEKGQFAPLDEYINAWEDKDDIIQSNYDAGSYNGKIYGIGNNPAPALLVYRKDHFKEVGLDPENPPKTWEELREAAKKLTVRNGNEITRMGLSFTLDGFKWTLPFARMNGATLTKDGQPNFDSPEWVETLNYFTEMFKDDKVCVERTEKQENGQAAFATGLASMGIMYPVNLIQMLESDPSMKDKIGFMMIERNGKSSTFMGNGFFFINNESKNKDLAWDFIKFTLSEDSVWEYYKQLGRPVNRKSMVERFVAENPWLNQAIANASAVGEGAEKVPYWGMIANKYLPQAQAEAFYGQKTPEQALKDAVSQLKSEIK